MLAFDGVDVLIHLAAAVRGMRMPSSSPTVVGTERLLGAMARSRTRRLVLASSFSVYDWSAIRGTLTEDSPVEPVLHLYDRDGYAIAKVWQERVARRISSERGWDLTVLRPGFIWGPGNEYLACLGQRLGPLHLVFGPRNRLPLTYVENCADLFAIAAEDPRAVGETFNVVDGDDVRAWQYLGDHLRRSGGRGLRVPVPYALSWAGVALVHRASRWVFRGKGKLPSLLVPCRFEARFKPLRYGGRKARDLLGWRPPYSYREGLHRTYGVPDAQLAPSSGSLTRRPTDPALTPLTVMTR